MNKISYMRPALVVLLFAVSLASPAAQNSLRGAGNHWVEDNFEDFRDGRFDSSGANLYVSADGAIETVNRWDVNKDGFIDLLIANTHDVHYVQPVWIYSHGSTEPIELPSLGAYRLETADLNSDGYPEIILGNRENNITERLPSYVYWNSAQGFSAGRRSELRTEGVSGIAASDLNQDGRVDLIFSNELGESSYIYWNANGEFSESHRTEVPTARSSVVAAGDINNDGFPDLVFGNAGRQRGGSSVFWGDPRLFTSGAAERLETYWPTGAVIADFDRDGNNDVAFANSHPDQSGQVRLYIYWNRRGFSPEFRTELPLEGPAGLQVADLNADSYPDLVVPQIFTGRRHWTVRMLRERGSQTSEPRSLVYWGGPHGFSASARTELPTYSATACRTTDYDGDGHLDLLFSQLRDRDDFETDSLLFRGTLKGFDFDKPFRFKTRGATDTAAADFNRDGKIDVAFANKISGNANGTVPTYVYLGSHEGFSSERRINLPSSGANQGSFADLNADGWTDVLVDNSDHDNKTLLTGSRIFWGSRDGIDPTRCSTIDVDYAMGSAIADLNRDGHLDIVFSCDIVDADALFVYWGPAFSRAQRTALPNRDGRATLAADLNNDGFLDIVATSVLQSDVRIFWGGDEGFRRDRFSSLEAQGPVSVEVADLNSDGLLELIVCNVWEPKTQNRLVSSYVYWGDAKGFSPQQRTELPTMHGHDAVVADLNDDGILDIVFANYQSNDRREVPSYIYWGAKEGYSPARRSVVPARGASAALAADFNRDGSLDLAFGNHAKDDGDHHIDSQVFWGPLLFRSNFKVTRLPGLGPHNLLVADIGNRFTRQLQEEYISSPFRLPPETTNVALNWVASVPPDAEIHFQIRSARDRRDLEQGAWLGPNGRDSVFEKSGASITVPLQGSWIQYRALFKSGSGANFPRLDKVEVTF